jgi:hypothetical protein
MMYPFSFFWKRISDEWLLSKKASISFAGSIFLIVAITPVLFGYIPFPEHGVLVNLSAGTLGVLGVLGIFYLWGGMWRFWIDCDQSKRIFRRVSFFLLLFGLCYGAIVYYFLVYLPAVRKYLHQAAAKEAT